jgi:hemerythrin
MISISWSDKFSIGVEMIDEQHKQLFNLINELNSNISGNSSKQIIASSLDALISYTGYHFREEEDYMFNVSYPRFEQHKVLHENLKEQVINFKKEFQEGGDDPERFLDFLYDWLTKHIMEQDKKIGKFMDLAVLRPIM